MFIKVPLTFCSVAHSGALVVTAYIASVLTFGTNCQCTNWPVTVSGLWTLNHLYVSLALNDVDTGLLTNEYYT